MEAKKSQKADLESKRNTFLLIGLVAALGLVLYAFEWKDHAVSGADVLGTIEMVDMEEQIIPITRQKEPEPPKIEQPKVAEIIKIVEDDVELIDEFVMDDTEADDDLRIEIAPITQTSEEKEIVESTPFVIVESMPEFPGGDQALLKFINNTLRYPVIAAENGIQGRVFYKFVVDVDGSVKDVEITRGVDSSLDKEAKRVLEKLPKFRPGKQRGVPVRVYYSSAINFRLD